MSSMLFDTAGKVATFKTWLTANASALSDQAAADLANASAAYLVWRTDVPKAAVRAAMTLGNYTPADNPPASTNTTQGTNDALLYGNRAFVCQLKQANALFLVQGSDSLDASNATLRQSMSDCMTLIPAGASGANVSSGWTAAGAAGAVRLALMRNATAAEKLYVVAATGAGNDGVSGNRGSNTNPDALTMEGSVTAQQVAEVRAS